MNSNTSILFLKLKGNIDYNIGNIDEPNSNNMKREKKRRRKSFSVQAHTNLINRKKRTINSQVDVNRERIMGTERNNNKKTIYIKRLLDISVYQ